MEDSLESNSEQVEYIFLYKAFEKLCPFFISIGMTYEQFWEDDPIIAKYYYKAYIMKEKRKIEQDEWHMWKQGVYIYEALCDVSPILHAFAKKGSKPLPYPEKPYGIDTIEEKTEQQKEQEQENERLRAIVFFNNWARNTQEQFEKKKQ